MAKIPWWRINFGDAEAEEIVRAIQNERISQGALTELFEREVAALLEVPHVVATTSGSVALLISFLSLELKPGDEVIVPNRTFIATAHAAQLAGATVVLVDTETGRPNMALPSLERAITPRTRAIAPVHLNGRGCDMAGILALAKKHSLAVVEDAAQAFFSKHALGYLGTLGDFGCFSLGASKLISTGQGGLIATRSSKLYEKMKLFKNHGVSDTFEATYTHFGFNFKFTDIQAAMGRIQLGRREEKIAHVNRVQLRYAEGLSKIDGITLIPVAMSAGEVPIYVEVLTERRPDLMGHLAKNEIQCRKFLPNLHYSPHLGGQGSFPHSERFHDQGIFLPAGPALPLEFVDRTVETIAQFFRSQ